MNTPPRRTKPRNPNFGPERKDKKEREPYMGTGRSLEDALADADNSSITEDMSGMNLRAPSAGGRRRRRKSRRKSRKKKRKSRKKRKTKRRRKSRKKRTKRRRRR